MLKKIFQDPRFILLIFLSTYTLYALITPGFGRTWQELVLIIFTCTFTDFLFLRFYKKLTFFPLSGFISSFGIFLMCDSRYLWIYALLAFLTISSKHLLAINNKHIFNPNNLALTIGVLFFEDKMTIINGRWGGHTWLVLLIITLGIVLIYASKRTVIVTTFLTSFIILAVLRSYYLSSSLTWVLMPLTGPAFFLFVFYMVTDPKTTPSSTFGQITFAMLLAIADALFRYNKNKYAPILSLFTLCGIYPSLIYLLESIKSNLSMVLPGGKQLS